MRQHLKELHLNDCGIKDLKWLPSFIKLETLSLKKITVKKSQNSFYKIQGKYRWRIIIKGKVNKNIIEAINYSLSKVKNQGDTTISIDINPNSMM